MDISQEIKLKLPANINLPVDITKLSNEEIYLILLIGINVFVSFKDNFHQDQEQIKKEISKKIEDSYQKIITEYEREKRELSEVNMALKRTFEEETLKTRDNYYEKIQEGIQYEIKNISSIYENQIKYLNNELKKYQDKIDILQDDLIKTKINTEKAIIDGVQSSKVDIEDQIRKQLDLKYTAILKQNESYQIETQKYQTHINELEKKIIQLREQQTYNEKEHTNHIELEINKRLKEKEVEFQNILDDYKNKIDQLKETIIQNEIEKKEIENKNMRELTHKCQELQENITKIKTEYSEYIVSIEKEKNENLNSKFEQNDILLKQSLQAIDELKKQKNANNYDKGKSGELYVKDLLQDSFYDFENFTIENTASKSHSGDYIMKFKQFSVIVDSKNYTNTVEKREIVKLEKDIANNSHIKVAWIISLNTPISGFSTYPVMYEIKNKVCYCYINSLNKQSNPIQFLRLVWYSCLFLFERIICSDTDDNLLEKYKKNENRIKNIIEKMMKKSKERYAIMNQMVQNFDETEKDLRELLSDEMISVQEMHTELVRTWWDKNIKIKENGILKTKAIYELFIKDENNKNSGINIDLFKNILKVLLPNDSIKTGKTIKSDYSILNVSFNY